MHNSMLHIEFEPEIISKDDHSHTQQHATHDWHDLECSDQQGSAAAYFLNLRRALL